MLDTLLLAAAISTAKPPAIVIDGDLGGTVARYFERAEKMKGKPVIIDGACFSACTLYLSNEFKLDVCITESALLGFHKPYKTKPDTAIPQKGTPFVLFADHYWTKWFYSRMPRGVQKMLNGRSIPSAAAGDHPGAFVYLKARDLKGVLPFCSKNWRRKYMLTFGDK